MKVLSALVERRDRIVEARRVELGKADLGPVRVHRVRRQVVFPSRRSNGGRP
jgi:hypothetical protein